MPSKLEDQLRALAEAQKATWAAKWPVERISATELGCDTRHMVQVGVTDDGEPIDECDGGLEPAAEGEKSVMDFLQRALGLDSPALLAEFQRRGRIEDAARAQSVANGVLAKRADGDGELQLARETRLYAAQRALDAALKEPSHEPQK